MLVGLTVFLAVGIFTWTKDTTKDLEEGVDFSQPIEADFDVEFRGVENCEESEETYCYEILITNNVNFNVDYLITTITDLGIEVESPEEYSLGAYESKVFSVYYSKNLGNQNVGAKVDVASLN